MSGWVAGAIVVGGVIGAVGSNMAAGKAASATRDASNNAVAEQRDALAQQQANAQPYMDLGTKSLPTYQALTSANPQQVQQTLENTPGYSATRDTGIEAAKRSSAASGLNLSGNQVAAVESFGAQLGDQTYQQAINNALTGVGIGQAAAAGQSANIGAAASNIGGIQIAQGNNIANIDANQIAGITKATTGATNQYMTYNTLQGLNNPAGGGNPGNLGGSTPTAPAGSNLTYDTSGNITGSAPIDTYGSSGMAPVG
jgi:hypothetical protein